MKSPNPFALLPVMGGLLALAAAGAAQAQEEQGRVISSTPVVQQIAVPRQVCQDQAVTVPGHKSGAGALMGGLAGGAMGNAVGNGNGRAVATVIGLLGGAILGDRVEGGGQDRTQIVQECSTQNFYENRTVAYNVVYEYAGRQYSTQMPNDPGQYVRLSVTPVGYAPPPPQYTPQPRVEYRPTAPAVTRVEVGTTYVPAPRVVYIGGLRQWQPEHPRYIHRDGHRDGNRSHHFDRDGDRWIRH